MISVHDIRSITFKHNLVIKPDFKMTQTFVKKDHLSKLKSHVFMKKTPEELQM